MVERSPCRFNSRASVVMPLVISTGLSLSLVLAHARAIHMVPTGLAGVPPLLRVQDDRASEDLPFGSRGGAAVRHHFPLDGEYEIRIALQGNTVRSSREPQEIDIRLDGARVALLRVGRWPEGSEPSPSAAGDLSARFPVRAGTHVVGVTFAGRTRVAEGVAPERPPPWVFGTGPGFLERMAVSTVEVAGPYNPDTVGGGVSEVPMQPS